MPSLEDHSISCYAIDGQILVLVPAREEDCFVIYSSPVFRPVEKSPWTVRSPNTRFEVYSKCLRTASVVGKLTFQIEHFSRRRHSRNCNSRCARKEKSVRASHSLLPNVSVAQWRPFEAKTPFRKSADGNLGDELIDLPARSTGEGFHFVNTHLYRGV